MLIEITHAVEFLGRLLHSKMDQNDLTKFKEELSNQLKKRFKNHWDSSQPSRGNGFRAVNNFNDQLDPILETSARFANVDAALIHIHLPRDFVLWIDPFSVSYRVGDHGNIMTLYEDRSRGRITLKADPATTQSPSSSPLMQHVQPRTSTAIRLSPPGSPEQAAKLKAHIHQSSPLARQKQQPQADDDDEDAKSRHQLVMAN